MKLSVKYIIIAIFALAALQACEKPSTPQVPDTPQQEEPVAEPPICTYEYDGKEYPVYSVAFTDRKSHV